MSHLISCLLLVPVLADAGWTNSVAAPPGAAPNAAAALASGSALSVNPPTSAPTYAPRQLPPPTRTADPKNRSAGPVSSGRAVTTVLGGLAVVLGVFFLVAWVTRKTAPRHLQPLPSEVMECLGRAPLAGRQQAQLIRLGRKLVLLAVTATEARALCEVTDPAEVERLAGLCQQVRPESITASFRQVLAQCAAEPAPRGAATVGAGLTGPVPRADARVAGRERRAS